AAFFFESDQVRRAEFDYVGIQNPIYTNAVGLLYYAYKQQPRYYQERGTAGYKKKPGLWQRFKDWLNEYIE
ncbi:MAG: hypothetical protein GX866_01415, partial [Firmicutes bacterium]|nr:hypothetical protein [Bacillota bacterium]